MRIADLAAGVTQRNPVTATLVEVTIDEWDGDIEVCGEVKRVGRGTLINGDRVVLRGSSDHAHFLIATYGQAAVSPNPHRSSLLTSLLM